MANYIDYRLALLLPEPRRVLGFRNSDGIGLPCVTISKYRRDAHQLTALVKERWGILSIVLDVVESGSTCCAILEVRTSSWNFEDAGFVPIHPQEIDSVTSDEEERLVLADILLNNAVGRGSFSRLGWLDEAFDWIEKAIGCRSTLHNEVLQMNAGGHFALMRFSTIDNRAYWLKATGVPNEREFTITRTLARLAPKYLPAIVAMRDDWNAWVMEEAGEPLSNRLTLPMLENAVRSLASLQIESMGYLDELFAAGCTDQRLAVLYEHLGEIFDFLEEAMRRQTSTKAPPLSRLELRELRETVQSVCAHLQEQCIADCLIHFDINPGNILVAGDCCTFIDWAEAYVGHPFLTFDQLCIQATAKTEHGKSWRQRLNDVYTQQWRDLLPAHKISHALLDAPLIAIVAHLYGRGDWLHSERRKDSNFHSYSRSLARHMYRAAHFRKEQEAVCH